MPKDKLLLLFPDGIGIKNYLYTDVFDNDHELVLFHNFNRETIDYISQHKSIDRAIEIPGYTESVKEKFLRELITLSRLYQNINLTGNHTLLANWVWKRKKTPEKIFYTVIETLAPFCKSAKCIANLDRRYQHAIRQNPFYRQVSGILRDEKPMAVFCSHQRGLKAATIFAAAADLGIPTVAVIYSWDNLPKGRLALHADYYLVWSDHMKQEMKQFFPEIAEDKVIVTGTPQFEFYGSSENIIDRGRFFSKYGLDVDKKTICFSGDDEMTSPDDPKYLKDLAEALTLNGLQHSYQILLRRAPVDLSGRYDAVIAQFPDLIRQAPPLWHNPGNTGWTGLYPLYDDVKLLVSTAYHCDIVVNIGSTMAFDFAMFNKPCAFINYDQHDKEVAGWSVNTIYEFQHFKSMPGKDPVIWINSKKEIAFKITNGIVQGMNPQMKAWTAIVTGNYQNASQRIKSQLQAIL